MAEATAAVVDTSPVVDTSRWRDLRVLVAEDHPTNQALMRWRLQQLGLPGEIVEDGVAALQELKRRHYDLLITDCPMPNMDGYELARAIRAWEHGEHRAPLPIIGLSANALTNDIQRCRDAGMDEFIAKPVALDALRVILARWLHSPAESAPSETPNSKESSPLEDTGSTPLIDSLTQRFGSDAIAREVVQTLLDTTVEDMPRLRLAYEARDSDALATRLHRVVGGLDIINATGIAQTTRRLMERVREEGVDACGSEVEECLADLAGFVEQLKAEVGRMSRTGARDAVLDE